jgi:hypothetical protein
VTFPVFRYKSRKLEDNLLHYGYPEEYLVSKDQNNRDVLAILPERCFKNKEKHYTICDGAIDHNKCTGCLACQIGVANPTDGVNHMGIPSEQVHYTYEKMANLFFKGKYVTYPSKQNVVRPLLRRFDEYTGNRDERNFTNPLIACYLWAISSGDGAVSCSPNHELSLDVSLVTGEREGHLDVTLRTSLKGRKYLFVAEGKRDVDSFLGDSTREQQKKYEKRIEEIGRKFGHLSFFSYVIGGKEETMYPSTVAGVPMHIHRNRFFHDILRNEKRFISIHALRGLGVLFISSKGKLCIENTLFQLLENKYVYGLVLGGLIVRKNERFFLQNLYDFITIR